MQKAQALPEEEETTSPLSGMKFLCAEDNDINAEILQMLLKTKGASCTICPNGQEIVAARISRTERWSMSLHPNDGIDGAHRCYKRADDSLTQQA